MERRFAILLHELRNSTRIKRATEFLLTKVLTDPINHHTEMRIRLLMDIADTMPDIDIKDRLISIIPRVLVGGRDSLGIVTEMWNHLKSSWIPDQSHIRTIVKIATTYSSHLNVPMLIELLRKLIHNDARVWIEIRDSLMGDIENAQRRSIRVAALRLLSELVLDQKPEQLKLVARQLCSVIGHDAHPRL